MINKERRHFKLRRTTTILISPYILGHSSYIGLDTSGYFTIRYSKSFVRFLGETFPHGIGIDRQVKIQVHALSTDVHVVSASYVDNSHAEVLWITDKKPKWVGKLKTKM